MWLAQDSKHTSKEESLCGICWLKVNFQMQLNTPNAHSSSAKLWTAFIYFTLICYCSQHSRGERSHLLIQSCDMEHEQALLIPLIIPSSYLAKYVNHVTTWLPGQSYEMLPGWLYKSKSHILQEVLEEGLSSIPGSRGSVIRQTCYNLNCQMDVFPFCIPSGF